MSSHPKRKRRAPAGASLRHQPPRNPNTANQSPSEILERHPPWKTPPLTVLELLITLFNHQHSAKLKEVSFKTRQERADFLRRFFHDLKHEAKFKTLPDPRHVRHCHIRTMVKIWSQRGLSAATIQTYFSFLRGLAQWIGKPGLVRKPDYYGLQPAQYRRCQVATRDKSWSARGIDIPSLIAAVSAFDPHVGAALRLIHALGLRRKEALMFRPHLAVVPFDATGLPPEKRQAARYVRISAGSKGGRERFIPLATPEAQAAIETAQSITPDPERHLGDPIRTQKQALRHFNYVLAKFGIKQSALGLTAHGLRHQALLDQLEALTEAKAPVRGGGPLPPEVDRATRQVIAERAGHAMLARGLPLRILGVFRVANVLRTIARNPTVRKSNCRSATARASRSQPARDALQLLVDHDKHVVARGRVLSSTLSKIGLWEGAELTERRGQEERWKASSRRAMLR